VKVRVYPADNYGCGHFRLIFVSEILRAQGHDVELVPPEKRRVELTVDGERVMDATMDADVVVFQRITHAFMAQAIPILRAKGVAVVVDIDDDLTAIHPSNPAYAAMHPRNERARENGEPRRHSWKHLTEACRAATLVTVSTPGLLERYARHGRGALLRNYLPATYFGVDHQDSGIIGWPAALMSHPDDPSALGGAVARLVADGADFRVIGDPTGAGQAFGLPTDPPGLHGVDIHGWPAAVNTLGVGIAPLADTRFNACKSWLKPLEMSALGIPWVASPRAEYAALHSMGAGLLADTPRRWYRALDQLRRSEAMRAEYAAAGRDTAAGLKIEDHAWRTLEAWDRALTLQRSPVTV
jgi:hypothetical protein